MWNPGACHHKRNFVQADELIPECWLTDSTRYGDFVNDNRAVFEPFGFGPGCVWEDRTWSNRFGGDAYADVQKIRQHRDESFACGDALAFRHFGIELDNSNDRSEDTLGAYVAKVRSPALLS